MDLGTVSKLVQFLRALFSAKDKAALQARVDALEAEKLDRVAKDDALQKKLDEQSAENRRLREQLEGRVVFSQDAYWSEHGDLDKKSYEGPYCPGCYQPKGGALIRMIGRGLAIPGYVCPVCDHIVYYTFPPKKS